MIFFGTKGRVITGDTVRGMQCPACGNSEFTSFGILKYFHLYWIPTFPTSKKVGLECTGCQQTLVDDEVPGHLVDQVRSGVFPVGKTLTSFTGLILIGVACLGMYSVYQADVAEEEAYLAQPAVNDYYIMDLTSVFEESDPDYPWGLLRIKEIDATEVQMQVGNMVYDKASGFRDDISAGEAAADSYYVPGTVSFDMAELRAYRDSGVIYSVERE